jgi:putative redox protein
MAQQKIRFLGATGDQLVGRLHPPKGPAQAWALFAHCFTCSKDLHAGRRISAALAARGIGTLRFDFTGIGESQGDFADTNFSSNVADLVAAANWLRDNHDAPSLLVGHSLGGAAVLMAASQVPESRAVITINTSSDPSDLLDALPHLAGEVETRGVAEVRLGGRTFTVKRQFLRDLREQNLKRTLATLHRALLILHSPQDEVVNIEHAARLYQAARHPKSYVSLDGADHLLKRPEDARYVGEVIAAWSSRYLPERSDPPGEAPSSRGTVQVTGGPTGYRQEVRAGPHRLVADEPKEIGGTDLGPMPHELLLSALGTCINMTLRMYAERKSWPLRGVQTKLQHRKVRARDREDGDNTRDIAYIDAAIALEGPELDDAQRHRLVEIAGRCPVHRTLLGEVRISTKLV